MLDLDPNSMHFNNFWGLSCVVSFGKTAVYLSKLVPFFLLSILSLVLSFPLNFDPALQLPPLLSIFPALPPLLEIKFDEN